MTISAGSEIDAWCTSCRLTLNHRVVAIDELRFDEDGRIVPVVLTNEGVAADPSSGGAGRVRAGAPVR